MPTEAPSGVGAPGIPDSCRVSRIRLHIEAIEVGRNRAWAVLAGSERTAPIHATGDTVPEASRKRFVREG